MRKFVLLIGLLFVVFMMAACDSQGSEESSGSTGSPNKDNDKEATDYPVSQIQMIIHAGAGGASDTVARTVANVLKDELGVPVVSTNKTGGSGAIAMNYVKDSDPDGYTIGYLPIEVSMLQSLGLAEFSPDDFEMLARANTIPATITVPIDAPYDTIEEFIQYAKDNPGDIKVGNAGAGSIWQIAAEAFASEADIDIHQVPFDGAAPAVTALMGGEVDAVPVSPSEVQSGVQGDKLKILAVMGEERDELFPEVPTLKEEGIDLEMLAWGGFGVSKDTPEDIQEILTEALEKAIESEEFSEMADKMGLVPAYQDSEEFTQFANDQYDFFSDFIPNME